MTLLGRAEAHADLHPESAEIIRELSAMVAALGRTLHRLDPNYMPDLPEPAKKKTR